MDFSISEDRRMLADSLSRYLSENYDVEHRNSVAYDAPFHDAERWAALSEMGIPGALVREAAGGFGGTGFDISTVFEELGRALCPEPFLGSLLAARVLEAAGADLDALIAGSTRYALAVGEANEPYGFEALETRADKAADHYVLNGSKSAVYGGNDADVFIVAALLGGKLAAFEVAAEDAGAVGYGLIDGGGAAELVLENAPAKLLVAAAETALNDALDAGRVALCAEAVGLMERTLEMTLDYLRQRKQFGVTIAKFQALQHRCVDLATELEQARSITILAAADLGGPDQARSVAMAKNLIGRAAKLMAEESIQLHGGIGMTWEYPGAHYAKRLVMLDHQLGDTDYHLQLIIDTAA